MNYMRLLAPLAVALAGTAAADAAGLLPNIDPGVIQTINQSASDPGDHNGVVQLPPGSTSGGGGAGLSQEEILQKLKDSSNTRPLITTSSGGGGSSGGSGGSDSPPGGPATLDRNLDYALACAVSANGQLNFANRGSETMPSGVRIKWKAGSETGFLRLNVDLEPGASAAAPHTTVSQNCWATVL